MPSNDQVHGEVAPEARQSIFDAIRIIRQALPFLIRYETDKQETLLKPGATMLQLGRQVPEAIAKTSSILPPSLVLAGREMSSDTALDDYLEAVAVELEGLTSDIRHTQAGARHDIMRTLLDARKIAEALGPEGEAFRQLLAPVDEEFKQRGRRAQKARQESVSASSPSV